MIIGSNFAENHPVVARWVLRAKDRGASIIVVDPRKTPTAWLADIHLQIIPGTDIPLINGMINLIVKEGLENRSFIKSRTSDFEDIDIERYTPEMVSEITGVPPADIIRAARVYARSRESSIVYCMGVTQHSCGTDNVTACSNLALVCGAYRQGRHGNISPQGSEQRPGRMRYGRSCGVLSWMEACG